MKFDKRIWWAGLPILLAAAYFVLGNHHETGGTAPLSNVRVSGETLRFAPHAPQLDYVKIGPVAAFPVPLADPLNARVAYDENVTARVSSPVSGRVIRIMTEEGKTVKKGDPLVEIDSPDYVQALADARKTEADLELKKKAEERAKLLYGGGVIARKDFEAAQADLAEAEADAMQAKRRLGNLNAADSSGETFILRAPLAGVISERQVSPGSEVRTDSPPLFVITDPSRLWVLADMPESDIGMAKVGQAVSVETDAYPGEHFPGKIAVVGEALDPSTRRFQLRCELDNALGRLKPEMFARVMLLGDDDRKLPRIPNSALVTQGVHSYVFVETVPGNFERRRVTLAMQGRENSYVKSGLKAGERIATSGALLLNSELSGSE